MNVNNELRTDVKKSLDKLKDVDDDEEDLTEKIKGFDDFGSGYGYLK